MFLAPYPVTKLFEFQEGYISTMVSVDMCKILRVLSLCMYDACMYVCRGGCRGGDVVTCHHFNLWVMVHPLPLSLLPYPLTPYKHTHTHDISHFLPPHIPFIIRSIKSLHYNNLFFCFAFILRHRLNTLSISIVYLSIYCLSIYQ